MDTTSRRPQLPALSYLDVDKMKREEESYQPRNTEGPQHHHSAPATSPTHHYPPGPPPYTHPPPQHANSWPLVKPSVHTPPDSRRTSGNEPENIKQTTRQSLPSISEALGEHGQTSYATTTSTPQSTSQASHTLHPQTAAPSSPRSVERRPYGMEHPQSHNSYPYSNFRQDSAGPYPPSDSYKPAYGISQESRPPLHLQTSQAPPLHQQPTYAYPQTTSPQYEQQPSQSSASMGPPSFPYGYTPYPPRYAQSTSSSSHNSGPIYQPSAQYAAPPTSSAASWKPESAARYGDDRPSSAPYGDSVKRHLDIYDLESALNDISQTSGIMLDFSRRYGDRMHQHARGGPTLSTLPSMVEVEDMINKSRMQMDSLNKIREVIVAQQAAYEQQMADQRQQQKAFVEPPPPEPHLDGEESKGGFAGSETKKPRRGRAAPPGRCHSCNRAETPEWRRGPDGARTLCNACGLHYAKLTRKQTTANKNTSVGSSNLRPKET